MKYQRQSILYLAFIIYTLTVLSLSRFNLLDYLMISFLSLPLMFIVPLRLGELICSLHQFISIEIDELKPWIKLLIIWLFGLLVLYASALFVSLSIPEFMKFFIWTILFIVVLPFRWRSLLSVCRNFHLTKDNLLCLISIISASFLYLIPRIYYLPPPMIGGASYGTILVIIDFLDNGIVHVARGHPDFIVPLLGLISNLFLVHPIYLFNALSYVIPFVYSFIIVNIVREISPNITGVMFAPILALFVITGEMIRGFSQHGLLYLLTLFVIFLVIKLFNEKNISLSSYIYGSIFASTGEAIVFAILFFKTILGLGKLTSMERFFTDLSIIVEVLVFMSIMRLNVISKEKKRGLFFGFLITACTILLHPFEGILLTSLTYVIIIFLKIKCNKKILLSLVVLFSAIWFLVQYFNILQFQYPFLLSRFFRSEEQLASFPAFIRSFSSKYLWLKHNAPESFLIAYLLSILLVFCDKNIYIYSILLISLLSLDFIFFPEGLFYRFKNFWAPTAVIIVAYSFAFLVQKIKGLRIKMKGDHFEFNINSKFIVAGLMFIFVLLTCNVINFRFDYIQKNLTEEGFYSYTRSYELKTALWLREKFLGLNFNPSSCLVLSDPYTMYLMHSWTGCSKLSTETAFIYPQPYSRETKAKWDELKNTLFMASNARDAFNYIRNISNNFNPYRKVYVVISLRTMLWERSNLYFVRTKHFPASSFYPSSLTIFSDRRFFKLIYEIPQKIYVYEVNQVEKPISMVNPMIIVDDNQTTFWKYSNFWEGNISLKISDDKMAFKTGDSSLRLNITLGKYAKWSLVHVYQEPQDWSKYDYLALWWNGNGSRVEIRFIIWGSSNRSGAAWIDFRIKDDFIGWCLIIKPLNLPNYIGEEVVDLAHVWKIMITPAKAYPSIYSICIDGIWLDNYEHP
ncbi:MAG: carbohydrate binding domain-containing protein [Promethearchaeota archaeon]